MNQKLLSHKPFKQLLENNFFKFWTVTKNSEREYVMCDVCLLTPLLWMCDHTCGSVTPAPSPGSCSAGLKLPLSPPPRPVWAPGRWHKLLPEKGETENQQHYLSQIHRPRTSVGKKRIKLSSTVINYVIFTEVVTYNCYLISIYDTCCVCRSRYVKLRVGAMSVQYQNRL